MAGSQLRGKDNEYMLVTLTNEVADGSSVAETLVKNGFRLKMLKEEEIDLEDVFMADPCSSMPRFPAASPAQ